MARPKKLEKRLLESLSKKKTEWLPIDPEESPKLSAEDKPASASMNVQAIQRAAENRLEPVTKLAQSPSSKEVRLRKRSVTIESAMTTAENRYELRLK